MSETGGEVLINCDMGEYLDDAIDQQLMPYVDQASIACGLHAGNNYTMRRTLALAKQHSVSVGTHPSYDDKQGFGRRAQHCAIEAVPALLRSQIDTLANLAAEQGVALNYVKPHGALYIVNQARKQLVHFQSCEAYFCECCMAAVRVVMMRRFALVKVRPWHHPCCWCWIIIHHCCHHQHAAHDKCYY